VRDLAAKCFSTPLTLTDVQHQLEALLEHGHGELRIVVHQSIISYISTMPQIRTQEELGRWHDVLVDKTIPSC